jgi:hypothetical protein
MILEVFAGEHIGRAAGRLVAAAKATNAMVEATFNGVRLVATPLSTAGEICRRYDDECHRQAAEWRNSPEGKAAAERDRAELARLQSCADRLLGRLPSLDFADQAAVLDWVCRFQPASDRVGVRFPRELILSTFARNGYHPNMNVGDAFDPEDRENVARYIVGQALDGLAKVGAIHPMACKFAADWREKFAGKATGPEGQA